MPLGFNSRFSVYLFNCIQFTTVKNQNNYSFCTNNKLYISVLINHMLAELKLNLR